LSDITEQQKKKVESILEKMDLEEKMAQLTGISIETLMGNDQLISYDKMAVHLALGIGQISLSAGATELPPDKTVENANRIQRFLINETRLRVPAIVNDECIAGFVGMGATHFPQAIGMAATWMPELSQRIAGIIGQQARAAGSHLMYSPVFDIGCDPRWGRIEETWGEDPYLVSRMGVAFVKGLRGENLKSGVMATLKHFAGYSISEGGRNCAPVHIGERELRDSFLLPFEAAVKEAGAESIMAAYHDNDGIPCTANRDLLTGILREEWGYKGIVIADWGAVEMLYKFHYTATDATEAGKQALSAGLDVENPSAVCYTEGLMTAVRQGEFPEELIDQAVRRHLRVKMLLGLFENPFVPVEGTGIVFDTPAQRAVALEAAQYSMTLLRNENKLLPLDKNINSIAVIGPNADNTRSLLGDYSYSVYKKLDRDAVKIISILEGIKNRVSPQTMITYVQGCEIEGTSTDGFNEALRAAAESDVTIVVVGGRSALNEDGTTGENLDRAELDLPGVQNLLIQELCRTDKPVIIVLVNGRPLAIEWIAENVQSILEAWLPGEEGGNAVADVLFGNVNPGGKLPVSLLRQAGQAPSPYNSRPSSFADSAKYVFTDREPVFPFGHGLSYTHFTYSDLKIHPSTLENDDIMVSCRVENTGERSGDEVVQLYIHDSVASVTRPRKELKGFRRISLGSGEKMKLTFRMPIELLSFHDSGMNRVVEPGVFQVMLGSSSEDIRLEGSFSLLEKRNCHDRIRFITSVTEDKI